MRWKPPKSRRMPRAERSSADCWVRKPTAATSPPPSTMHSSLRLFVVVLPIVASFTVRPATYPASRAAPAAASSCQKRHQFHLSSGRRSRSSYPFGSRTRRQMAEGKGSNMDSSDDDDEDAEIYASLRRRLEELEKSAPIADQVEAARSPET